MKKARKLIPAIAMLLMSAVMLTTSSYAWFSMNTTVTATNMTVTAKSDSAYLVISSGKTLPGNDTSANATTTNKALYPVKPVSTLTSSNVGTVTSWGTATSSSPDSANSDAQVTALDSNADLNNYVLINSFMVGIVGDSGKVNNPLKIKSVTITDSNSLDGITVVVVCGNNIHSFATSDSTSTDKTLADTTAVTATGVQVDVYIYIDGSNEKVTSNNAAKLGGSVSLTFTIDKLGA